MENILILYLGIMIYIIYYAILFYFEARLELKGTTTVSLPRHFILRRLENWIANVLVEFNRDIYFSQDVMIEHCGKLRVFVKCQGLWSAGSLPYVQGNKIFHLPRVN